MEEDIYQRINRSWTEKKYYSIFLSQYEKKNRLSGLYLFGEWYSFSSKSECVHSWVLQVIFYFWDSKNDYQIRIVQMDNPLTVRNTWVHS